MTFNFVLTRVNDTTYTATDADSGMVLKFTVVDAAAHTLKFTAISENPNNVTILDLTHFEEASGQEWSVVTVGNSARNSVRKIVELRLPNSLEKIEWEVFSNDDGQSVTLTTVKPLMPKHLSSIGTHAFWKTHITGDLVLSCKQLAEIGKELFTDNAFSSVDMLNTSVTNIGAYAFANNPNLEKVILPATLNKVANYAFYNTKNLKQIYFASGEIVKKLPVQFQTGCPDLGLRVYVPKSSDVWRYAKDNNWGKELTDSEKATFEAAYPGEKLPLGKIKYPTSTSDNWQYLCTWRPSNNRFVLICK